MFLKTKISFLLAVGDSTRIFAKDATENAGAEGAIVEGQRGRTIGSHEVQRRPAATVGDIGNWPQYDAFGLELGFASGFLLLGFRWYSTIGIGLGFGLSGGARTSGFR